ncbi:hypothetical protein L226DRAFT_563981 [Lentinus tigrinus ALCF2SS1-7]|uniref:Uncharacterized protein n=1 Tax=Lentinus tigrinus ALCF2SS1-6 TaxID=1328759 RepID=A0A5C2RSE2_9APHY|nr:hypothetical protein L227DRAFT_421634 [Lentinus tigrinus ALCF2SS1-6]RPD68293.1 hypothetical protein L226DRAFT_563981 [Lentinus tigrinus ALCF2SS1-7]
MLSLSEAAVLSTTLEAILYGFSLFMFILTFRTVFRNYRRRRLNYGMFAATCALLLLSSAEMGVNVARLYQGFISRGPTLPGGSEEYFSAATDTTFLLKSCLYNVQTIILDAVVIYRAYVVWQSLLIVLVPVAGWCGLVAVCIGLNVSFSKTLTDAQTRDVFGETTGRWITATYSLTLATNLLTTVILALKIWQVARRSARYLSESSLTPILHVIVESGAIYSITVAAALVAFLLKSNVVYVILDMISPIISIVFSMIIVRVSSNTESGRQTFSASTHRSPEWTTHFPRNLRRRREGSSFGMGDISIEITEAVHIDREVTPSDLKPPGIVPGDDVTAGSTTPEFHRRDAGPVCKASEEPV